MDDADAGETTITRMALRPGGWIGYNDESVYIDRDGGDRIKIRHRNVARIGLRNVEWDVVIMSLVLVALGVFVGATRNPLVGVGFAVAGFVSLYWSYRKRYELAIHVENERTPIAVYPTHPAECHETLVERVRAGTED